MKLNHGEFIMARTHHFKHKQIINEKLRGNLVVLRNQFRHCVDLETRRP